MNHVNFALRKNANSDPMIRMVLRHNNQKFVWGTGMKIPENLWDKRKMRASKKFKNHGSVNVRLNKYEETLINVFNEFEENGIIPSNAQIKAKLDLALEDYKKSKVNNTVEITPYIRAYIARIKNEGVLAKGTIQGYDQLLNNWEVFYRSYGLSFEDLNIHILEEFQNYMLDTGYSQNQREKIQRKLITILRYAENADKIKVNTDYKLNYWRVGVAKDNVRIYLSNDEIKKIRDFEFEEGSLKDQVRDRWIIGFATGQRYSDFKDLSKDNLRCIGGKLYIEVIQQKTNKVVKVPLYDDVTRIFDKYGGYPPVFSAVKFNEIIKEIAKDAGLNDEVTKIIQLAPNKKKVTVHPKYELVTSHICRRSFATNGTLMGLSMGYLREITGHRKPQTFLDYINLRDTDIPVNMPSGNSLFG